MRHVVANIAVDFYPNDVTLDETARTCAKLDIVWAQSIILLILRPFAGII